MTTRRLIVTLAGIAVGVLVAAVAVVAVAGRAPDSSPRVLSGDLAAHDPALVAGAAGHPWYVFSTGSEAGPGTIEIRRSADGLDWQQAGTVWKTIPAWISDRVPGVKNLWAPELFHHAGTWYLYYSASTFGSNHSLIALATNTTLDSSDPSYRWVDRGVVVGSEVSDDFNAIDPGIVEDSSGTPWMTFGSFWSGIRMVELDWPSGLRAAPADTPLRIADRQVPPNAVEAAYTVSHDGWFYLFVSFDSCCRGLDSTYNIDVGRSRSVTGPYVDRRGRALLEGGGSVLLATDGREIGPGGQSVSRGYLAYHFYDRDAGGAATLGIRQITWGRGGWPTL
ncbi:arabinan endo-1,5-alpha-L-arabinosidase [Lacisediminihabitans sp. FW035]